MNALEKRQPFFGPLSIAVAFGQPVAHDTDRMPVRRT